MIASSRTLPAASLLAAISLLAACGNPASDAPPLAEGQSAPAQQKPWLETAGDNTWNAVASPINGLIPRPTPKPAPIQLTPTEPPDVIMIPRGNRAVTTEPPTESAPIPPAPTTPSTAP